MEPGPQGFYGVLPSPTTEFRTTSKALRGKEASPCIPKGLGTTLVSAAGPGVPSPWAQGHHWT